MNIIGKKLKLNKYDYFKVHLNIINSVLPIKLTNKEIEVLAGFMSLEGELAKDPFCTYGRKVVMEQIGMKSVNSMCNYINHLTNKKFLLRDEITGKLSILPILVPNSEKQEYRFEIIKNIDND